jgi:hypothetical protein
MWALLNIIFLLVFIAVAFAAFFAIWAASAWLICPKRPRVYMALSVPAFALICFGIYFYLTRPSVLFSSQFGFPPTSDVQNLRASMWSLGDSGRMHMRFIANPSTIQRIVARGLGPESWGGALQQPADAPDWWSPSPDSSTLIYHGTFTGRSFGTEMEYLIYDPNTKEAHFLMLGVD